MGANILDRHRNGSINDSKIEYVQEVDDSLLLKPNDLLFNRTNSHDLVAKVAVYKGEISDKTTFASYLVRLRTNHLADPYFLNYYLNSKDFIELARRMAIPSVQQANLNPSRYGRIEIPVPPIEEQNSIVKYLDVEIRKINDVQVVLQKQIKVLTDYRKSLIHECVTGKKRVYFGQETK